MRAPKLTALAAATLFAVSLAACGNDSDSGTEAGSGTGTTAPAPTSMMPSPTASAMNAAFGPGCSALPTDPADKGSAEAMAQVPVATAASGNPLLSTLVSAVKQAGLVDTLNSADGITVFAPTNDAFAKIPEADLKKVLADKKMLTDILTYHVVEGRLTPADVAGTKKTLQGGELNVTGSGESWKVNDASVVCGNVQTANANVYLIDTVLMPKS